MWSSWLFLKRSDFSIADVTMEENFPCVCVAVADEIMLADMIEIQLLCSLQYDHEVTGESR